MELARSSNNVKFDKRITNICKGIAILLMIVHHIFPGMENYGLKIANIWVMPQLAIFGKVCVSIFLVLSGYGLYESSKEKPLSLPSFYGKRLKSIYVNYWIIFIIFTALGYSVYRPYFLNFISSPYSPNVNLLLSFLGLQYFVNGYMGFNPSWWFISQILLLYLIFPLMRKMMQNRMGTIALGILSILFATVYTSINIKGIYINFVYFTPFIVGVFFSKYRFFESIYFRYKKDKRFLALVILSIGILGVLRVRAGLNNQGIRLDCILAPLICILAFALFGEENTGKIGKVLEYLGVHSFNIYLIHLFITNMYMTPIIYGLNSPIVMVGATVLISLAFSIVVEKIKQIGSWLAPYIVAGQKKILPYETQKSEDFWIALMKWAATLTVANCLYCLAEEFIHLELLGNIGMAILLVVIVFFGISYLLKDKLSTLLKSTLVVLGITCVALVFMGVQIELPAVNDVFEEEAALNYTDKPSSYQQAMQFTENTVGNVFEDSDVIEQSFIAQNTYLESIYFLVKPREGAEGTPLVTIFDSNGVTVSQQYLVHGEEDGTTVVFDAILEKNAEYTIQITFEGISGDFVGYFNVMEDTDGTCGSALINGEDQGAVLFAHYHYQITEKEG